MSSSFVLSDDKSDVQSFGPAEAPDPSGYFVELARTVIKSESEGNCHLYVGLNEQDDMKAFLLCYRRFGNAKELWNIWSSYYKLLKNGHRSKLTKTHLDRYRYFVMEITCKFVSILDLVDRFVLRAGF